MLVCEDWTLTQSSGWSAVDVGLALELGVALALGLAAMRASRDAAEIVADVDGDAVAELDWVDEAEPDGVADVDDLDGMADVDDLDGMADVDDEAEAEADGEGEAGRKVGLLVGALPGEADVVGVTLTDGVGVGDGVVVRVGLGVGVGIGVLVAGSTWQFGPAVAEAVGLAVAPTALREPARAIPVQAVSAARITKPPARKLSAVARRCVKRTSTNLSTLLVPVTGDLYVVRSRPGDGWASVLISGSGLVMRERVRRSWRAALAG
jgi:hypothetical protein